MKNALRSLLKDEKVMAEIQAEVTDLESFSLEDGTETLDVLDGRVESLDRSNDLSRLEAIILLRGRPVLLIQDNKWEKPRLTEIEGWLDEQLLGPRIPSVGRIEVVDSMREFEGTGWMLEENILITNRHVAEAFALRKGAEFGFRNDLDGNKLGAMVDFRREHQRPDIAQATIEEIIYLEEAGDVRPDMALMRINGNGMMLPDPIELDSDPLIYDPANLPKLAAIGYPAEDSRNDAHAQRTIFGNIYRVKRLSPGKLMTIRPNGRVLEHDCTVMGGSSGSPIINLATGKVCALHFAGSYRDRNLAATSTWIKSRLSELATVSTFVMPGEEAAPAVLSRSQLATREGYNPLFLGTKDLEVPFPLVDSEQEQLIAKVDGDPENRLHYTHFSIQMRKDRKLPFFTACNIDGEKLFRFTRGSDKWFLDGRISLDEQIGEELYKKNNLDRGHLVRRLDPVWGDTRQEAKQAELDTFMFTNCSPQHSRLNQRTWLDLEEYILGNIDNRDFKASIFTGPVMSDGDREYRGIKIPDEYWKVAVMVNKSTGQLSATGYLLSQKDYLKNIEFVFGEFKTYQVALSLIEEKTGLSFDLSLWDPLGATENIPVRLLAGMDDIVL